MTDYSSEDFWKGAPEGATHYFAPFFYRADETRAYVFETTWSPSAYTSRQIGEIGVKKPAASPPWSGDGLPPVGVFVRITDDGSLRYGSNESGEVIAHVEDCAVVRMSYGLGCFTARYLEPIKTTAQIAAEEREATIEAMIGKIKDHPLKYQSVSHFAQLKIQEDACADLYDAGLRFPKGDDK